jgi:hypothetical protein
MSSGKARRALLALALLTACAQRPPWADGRIVRERAPDHPVPQDFSNFESRILAVYNRERALIGIPPLIWDPALAAAARGYGPALSKLGKLAHSDYSTRRGQGENLFMGTRGAYTLDEMTADWVAEKRLFRPGIFPNVSSSGHGGDVGHYTQMIWRTTSRVGCAVYSDAKWDFFICRYAPPGNVLGWRVP